MKYDIFSWPVINPTVESLIIPNTVDEIIAKVQIFKNRDIKGRDKVYVCTNLHNMNFGIIGTLDLSTKEYTGSFDIHNSTLPQVYLYFIRENGDFVDLDIDNISLSFYENQPECPVFLTDFYFNDQYTTLSSQDLFETHPKIYVSRDIILPTTFANLIGYHSMKEPTFIGLDAALWTTCYPVPYPVPNLLSKFFRRCEAHNIKVYLFNLPDTVSVSLIQPYLHLITIVKFY